MFLNSYGQYILLSTVSGMHEYDLKSDRKWMSRRVCEKAMVTGVKKILLLGGSAQQVVAIDAAKRLGYYTVLCAYLPDNPGQYAADKFYPVSTTDKEYVLEIAEKERINGVLAYASDPAAPTAAYVAEKMGLPGNPYPSVEILCNKDQFRKFLAENGFSTPKAKGFPSVIEAGSKYI